MNISTSVWFSKLTQAERKTIIVLLFGYREDAKKFPTASYKLFCDLIQSLDAEYHALKETDGKE